MRGTGVRRRRFGPHRRDGSRKNRVRAAPSGFRTLQTAVGACQSQHGSSTQSRSEEHDPEAFGVRVCPRSCVERSSPPNALARASRALLRWGDSVHAHDATRHMDVYGIQRPTLYISKPGVRPARAYSLLGRTATCRSMSRSKRSPSLMRMPPRKHRAWETSSEPRSYTCGRAECSKELSDGCKTIERTSSPDRPVADCHTETRRHSFPHPFRKKPGNGCAARARGLFRRSRSRRTCHTGRSSRRRTETLPPHRSGK